MGWLIVPLLIIVVIIGIAIVVIIGIAFVRSANSSYRFGSGMFKSSEYNLDEKDEISDKEYYDKDGLLK